MSGNVFSPDYFTARQRFREMAAKSGGRLEALPLDARGPAAEDLTIDIAWFGAPDPRRVLLHCSGLHGVEGFAGSAIQLQALEDLPRLSSDTALVIAHILNPYGMAWLRRVNEHNVDLNRNCLDPESYGGAPSTYVKLDSFLNPQSPPAPDFYLLKAAGLVLRYGMPALKQSVVGGQYEYPRGLFFGGTRLEQGLNKFRGFVNDRLASAPKLVVVDVHTGLGKYGEDTLLVPTDDYDRLHAVFGERVTPLEPRHGPAYRVRGGLSSVFRARPDTNGCLVCQEFGTYGPLRVLHALREENRWHHYGAGTLDHPVKQTFKRTFCPDDQRWRQSVLDRGAALLGQAMSQAHI